MPGVFGYYGKEKNDTLANDMASLLTHGENWFSGECLYHEFGFHGVVDFKSHKDNYVFLDDKSLVVYGNIYSFRGKNLGDNKAETVLSLYEKYGLDFLKDINGSFVLSIYDGGKLIIAADRLGSKNLLYTTKSDGILYSSEIKAILADKSIETTLNHEAIAEFFTFSFPLDNKTFFEGIKLLPPASILICHQDKMLIKRYWDFKFDRKKQKDFTTLIKEFEKIMEKAVEIRMADKDKIGIFLSGGLDSRLIAGFAKRIADRTNKELISFTFGTKGGWQEKIASKVASELGIENRFYEIPSDSISKYAEEVVYKGDGHIRIRDAHFISLLSKVKSEVDTVLVGFFCSELFGEMLSANVSGVSTKAELVEYLFSKYEVKQTAGHIPEIFQRSSLINLKRVKENFIKTVNGIPFDSYDEIADYWELRQRDRRYILPLSNYISCYLDVRLPYLDNEVIDFAVNLPLELRFGKSFIHKALKHIFPDLANIPLEKSGVPPDTTGLPLILFKMKRLADARLKTLIERISFGKVLIKPPDYKGYEYWLRTGSKKYVEGALLQEPNEIFNREYIRKIVEEHMKGKKNHDQIICDVLNINLLMDKFIERKAIR